MVFSRAIGRQLFIKKQSALLSLYKTIIVINFLILEQYLKCTTAVNTSTRYGTSSLYTSFRTLFAILFRPRAFPLRSFSSSLSNSVSVKSQGIVKQGSILVLLKISNRSTSKKRGVELANKVGLAFIIYNKGIIQAFSKQGKVRVFHQPFNFISRLFKQVLHLLVIWLFQLK